MVAHTRFAKVMSGQKVSELCYLAAAASFERRARNILDDRADVVGRQRNCKDNNNQATFAPFAMSDNIKNGRKSFTQFRLFFFPTTELKFKMSILFNGACILYDCEGETPV